jgi:TetR/AcrR family transcriptional repressor of mexJK operon
MLVSEQLARSSGGDRSAAKRRTILVAATTVFLRDGYHGASMDEIATLAAVSKPTVYRHFVDKGRLFSEIIRGTMDRVDTSFQAGALALDGADEPGKRLRDLGRRVLTALLQPEVLQLRRLVIGESGRFPELGRTYWEDGFDKGLVTLAAGLERMARRGQLSIADPLLAAGQFAGLVLWVPANKAMLCGHEAVTDADIDHHVDTGVRTFLAAYSAVCSAVMSKPGRS